MRLKRGQVFAYTGTFPVLDGSGKPVDLTGWHGASQVRRMGAGNELVEQLAFDWIDPAQQTFTIRSAGTALWPLDTLLIDIVITSSEGHRIPSSTAKITVEREVTHA